MIKKIEKMFNSDLGKHIYESALSTVSEHSMDGLLTDGALLGLSGGADSVMLLLILNKYFSDRGKGKILAAHVNHMIRGDEADRDELFSRDLCKKLNIEFISEKIDVPFIARKHSLGIEEAARNARYSYFYNIISGRKDVSCIAVAHNSTDNAETVIFNMLRGSGSRGISGIRPLRDKIIRPLIGISKSDIVSLLDKFEIPYVTDSTNLSVDYTRNYIRHEILPRFSNISNNPEAMITRLSANLRCDSEYIDSVAAEFLSAFSEFVPANELAILHTAVLSRVIKAMADRAGAYSCEYVHIIKIRELLGKGDFKISLPGEFEFISSKNRCFIAKTKRNFEEKAFFAKLKMGFNLISGFSGAIFVSDEKIIGEITDSSSKVYKISIQQAVDSAIINGELSVRSKIDGDSYFYGGMTHKLKKLFNDRKIPIEFRDMVPVICDESGIIWVPGFGVRQSNEKSSEQHLWFSVLEEKNAEGDVFYISKRKGRH